MAQDAFLLEAVLVLLVLSRVVLNCQEDWAVLVVVELAQAKTMLAQQELQTQAVEVVAVVMRQLMLMGQQAALAS
jgi:hypothetical protein